MAALACQDIRHLKVTNDEEEEEEERKDWGDYAEAPESNEHVCVCGKERETEALAGLEVIRIRGRASLNTLGMTVAAHTLLAACWFHWSAAIGVGSSHST